jgi:hypothetical protein
MKTKLKVLKGRFASSLLVTLFMMTILAVSIAGYLYYVEQQNKLSARSQAWNMAMAISEAGIEEGLEALNSWPTTDCPPGSQFTGNGWTSDGNNVYHIRRDLPNGYYVVTNDLSDCYHPIITARGFVTPPAMTSGLRRFFFAAVGTVSTPTMMTRAVQVKTSKTSIWVAAMAARGSIGMSGNSDTALVNSFDDTANNGIYTSSEALSNAVVASLLGTVSVGNWNIDGRVDVSPTGSTYVGPNGYVSGGISQDANFTFPEVDLPDTSAYTVGSIPGTNWPTMVSPGSTSNTCNYPTLASNQTMSVTVFYFTNTTPTGCNPVLITSNNLVSITSSNNVVTMLSSNLVCGATSFSGNSLPANVCSFTVQGTGNGAKSYRWTLIAGTNVVYQTNTIYTYATNNIITYAQSNYTVYTAPVYVTNNYAHVLCGNYVVSDPAAFNGSGGTYVACPSTVVAQNGIQLTGVNDQILLGPGATLALYSEGAVKLAGQGLINTNPGVAENFSLTCTTNVTSVDISGNGQFTGTVLAPNANVNLSGGGSGNMNVIGAIMANTITLHGHMSFHYPESLSRKPSSLRYLVVKWQELD